MKKISYLFIIAAAILWGSIGLFSKIAGNKGFTPIDICFIRSCRHEIFYRNWNH